jgi:serine/threonine protein kinase/tetratricopeptide (TPR) repeat protein
VPTWEHLKELFDQVVDVAPGERAACLDKLCGDDVSLRAELQRLLDADEQARSFMPGPVVPTTSPTASESPAVFSPGQKVADRFRIIRFLGEGGMGQVYQAEDEVLGGLVALKTIRPEIASDERTFERFKREVRLAKEVTDENVCRVFDLDNHNVPPFVTMELVDGETLSARLRREGKMTTADALPLVEQMAQGLGAAHQKGIIHRDFKPGNVMLARPGSGGTHAKVTDFGLARTTEGDSIGFAKLVGTPSYMAPEQIEGRRATVASDIYALGLVMYEMVIGTKPEFQRLTEPAPSPRLAAPTLDPNWEAAILRCLERDPASRFSNATDVLNAIRGERSQAQTPTPVVPNPAIKRRKLIAAAILTPALIGALTLTLRASRPLDTSVMVYPITNVTNNADYDYLCKGTTAELIRRISQLEGVRVIPFYEPPARAPIRRADTRFAFDGQLQEFHKQIRLTVQLTDRRDGTVVWSQNFEQELQNPLELQSQIAQHTVEGLELRIFGASEGDRAPYATFRYLALQLRRVFGFQLPKPPTKSRAAMEAYMRGRHLWDERTLPTTLSAIDYFRRAVKEDPRFALAYAALADAQFGLMDYNYAPQVELLRQAREYAEQAVALGPELAETYVSFAAVRQALWDWPGAERSFQHAIRLNPKMAVAHRWYGGLMVQFARFDEAFKEVQIALKLDPYSYPSQSAYGLYLFYARKYQDAVEQLERTLAEKDFLYAHINLGYVYAKLGAASTGPISAEYFEKAFREAAIVAEAERPASSQTASGVTVLPFSDSMYALFHAMTGDRAASLRFLRRLEKNLGESSRIELSQIYAALGEREKALDLLERGAVNKDRRLSYIKVQPYFDSIRDSPRFQELLRQMAL